MKNTPRTLTEKYIFSIVLILIGLSFVFRFWMLGVASFGTDSVEFYKMSLRGQSILELWRNPPWMNQIPLNETLSLLMVKVGLPATPFIVRLPFAVMGVLALFFVWRFARRWFGTGPALLTLLLAVFNPYQLYFSRTAYHYSGAICWSAALFMVFWAIHESIRKKEPPDKTQLVLWFLAAITACHMHMSAWIVVGLQGFLLLLFGFRLKEGARNRYLLRFLIGTGLLGALMSRWFIRAVQEVLRVSGENGTGHLGVNAGSEFLRLLPAYFAGENIFDVALLLIFIALAVYALFGASDATRRYRSLAGICVLHIAVLMLYVAVVGGGVAKITYFSAIWPHFILLLGIGSFLGVRSLASMPWRVSLYTLLAGGYLALTGLPVYAIIRLDGSPTPYYKINDWVLHNLPAGTPVLTDRWFEPWNELAVHNPGNINYTFTVPDDPIETYRQLNWRKTVEPFFEKYPEAAFLELERGKYEATFGKWDFPQSHFARCASITNESALALRHWKVFLVEYGADAITNRVITRIYYNTPEDLVAAAQRAGKDVLRLYGAGWGYAKPGWQQGHFEDYRILKQVASIDLYNLKESPLSGTLEISAATADKPKPVSVNGATTVFASGRIRTWSVPLTLQSGKNTIPFASPSADPLFVLDIRWKPAQP
jgi:hypothetical protein